MQDNQVKGFQLSDARTSEIIDAALHEDIGTGDVTSNAIIDENSTAKASWIAKENGTICGLDVAEMVFRKLDRNMLWNPRFKDGDAVQKGDVIVEFEGLCRAVLTAERVALNFAQRMSGISTQTSKMVKALDGFDTRILDTRKTVPGLRALDKYAVAAGGGTNHRMGLYDMAMIKDNHIVAAGGIVPAVERVRRQYPEMKIEVETTSGSEVNEAIRAGADIIMLDNMNYDQMKNAVQQIAGRAETEASGNITLETVVKVAETGVDFISAGALTHSVKAFDISQRVKEIN